MNERIYRALAPLLLMGLLAQSPLHAQSEDALAKFFEGRTVAVKMDMPANKDGVDVFPERQPRRKLQRILAAREALWGLAPFRRQRPGYQDQSEGQAGGVPVGWRRIWHVGR